jgi:hypothetical protein
MDSAMPDDKAMLAALRTFADTVTGHDHRTKGEGDR